MIELCVLQDTRDNHTKMSRKIPMEQSTPYLCLPVNTLMG